jgi:DNA-binding transcriptional regulator YiaG
MDVIGIWTGPQANALLRALRLTNEGFADRLGIAVRTVAKWNANPTLEPTPEMQQALDTLLARAPDDAKARFAQILKSTTPGTAPVGGPTLAIADIAELVSKIADSSTSDDAINQLTRATTSLAEAHTQAPATRILTEVLRLHSQVQTLLQGRLRLSQQRELFRIESELLAHACLLLGDLKQDQVAENCGHAALSYAREAGANQAIAWSVLSKTLRWEERFIESADMARQGYDCSPLAPVRQHRPPESQPIARTPPGGRLGTTRQTLRNRESLVRQRPQPASLLLGLLQYRQEVQRR